MHRFAKVAALVAVGALTFTACGGTDPGPGSTLPAVDRKGGTRGG